MDTQVEEIKARLNVVDVVGQYVKLERAGKNFRALCPFHKERTASFNVSPERGTYICFGCGEKGDIFSFIEKIEGVDFKTALEELAHKAGVTLERRQAVSHQQQEKDVRLREVCEASVVFYQAQLRKRPDVLEYIHTRGVKEETIISWRIGYAPAKWQDASDHLTSLGFTKEEIVDAGIAAVSEKNTEHTKVEQVKDARIYDRFRGRIMFPISDVQGRAVAFSGRIFEEMKPKTFHQVESLADVSQGETFSAKYVNSPETLLFKKSRILFGLDKAKSAIRRADCLLLVEGQFDVVLCHQSGLPYAVALSGTALTSEHLSLMSRYSKRLVLALDADAAGIRSGLKSTYMALQVGFDVKIPVFQSGKDPADVAKENPDDLKTAIRTSKTAIEFFLEILRAEAKDMRMYKKIVESRVLPLIAAIVSKIDQEHFIHLVALKLQVPESAVREEVQRRKTSEPDVSIAQKSTPEEVSTLDLDPIDKKAAMLLFSFPSGSVEYDKLASLLGAERLAALKNTLEPEAEKWRFRFEAELEEHSGEVIAKDMLADIERRVERDRFKMRFL